MRSSPLRTTASRKEMHRIDGRSVLTQAQSGCAEADFSASVVPFVVSNVSLYSVTKQVGGFALHKSLARSSYRASHGGGLQRHFLGKEGGAGGGSTSVGKHTTKAKKTRATI